jgi:hypothetical protein
VVEKTGRRGHVILMLAPIVYTSERVTAGATKSEKSFFLTGSLQSITWGAARKERKRKMNLIREIFFSPMVVDAAGIILIVAALPMVGWSWAVSHMAGPKVKNAKEGT